MTIGAHISTQGGTLKALDRARDLGVQAIQLHPSSPQTWAKPQITDEQAAEFTKESSRHHLGPIFFHAIYLVNFASTASPIWHGSITATRNYLALAQKMAVRGVITHLGSTKGADWQEAKKRVILGLRRSCEGLEKKTMLILETAAGAGNIIGDDLNEIAEVFQAIKDEYPCGICLDTAHLFESGVAVHTARGLAELVKKIDQTVGLENLAAIHLNDSQTAFGSKIDRHANIGAGQIGADGLGRIINEPAFAHLPFILEVPGFANTGPDRENIEIVRDLIKVI